MKIAFYKGSKIVDRVIEVVTRGAYSHVAIVLNDGSIIEAYPFKGVRKRKSVMDGMKGFKIDIYEVPTTPSQDADVQSFLEAQVGKGYDWWAIFGFVLYTTEASRKKYGRWICSELVFQTCKQAGVTLLQRVDPWKVSPTILSYNTIMTYVNTVKT